MKLIREHKSLEEVLKHVDGKVGNRGGGECHENVFYVFLTLDCIWD